MTGLRVAAAPVAHRRPELPPQPSRRGRRWTTAPVAIVVGGLVGLALLLFPVAADWVSTIGHDRAIAGYLERGAELRESGRADELLAAAEAYNRALPDGPLLDPYSVAVADTDAGPERYRDQLQVGAGGVVARVTVPRLGIDLPVELGADERVLRRGAGHLPGSSLPVGGAGTHSVLTAHTGAPYAALFTPLHEARPGDVIEVEVLDRRLRYRVTTLETVRPDETASLARRPGEDLLTLLTCTPIGVNTHRLLVHAERMPDEAPASSNESGVAADPGAGDWLPTALGAWWIPAFLLGAAGVVRLARPVR